MNKEFNKSFSAVDNGPIYQAFHALRQITLDYTSCVRGAFAIKLLTAAINSVWSLFIRGSTDSVGS
jgi:hypothetical protein